jgi:hypothetical protein
MLIAWVTTPVRFYNFYNTNFRSLIAAVNMAAVFIWFVLFIEGLLLAAFALSLQTSVGPLSVHSGRPQFRYYRAIKV